MDAIGNIRLNKLIIVWFKIQETTLKPLYKMVHYNMVSDIRQFKGGPQKCFIQQKCIDYIEK